ncbi:MAG TPA: methyltransferase domain-containing protein [Steroidobacteraceae bacterium]|nr:methyltransferase domain-containing protein [Steroidobacteraceae bacterium]
MHKTALDHAAAFYQTYGTHFPAPAIVEVGSADVNGSLRQVAPAASRYIGLDFAAGPGVDVVLTDPYRYPLETASVDIAVSSSCFEHADFFWLSFLEILRVVKPNGLVYLNVPSNGAYHRHPLDSWRFYPDAGIALSRWAQRSGVPTLLLESFIGWQDTHMWNDFVGVFVKDRRHAPAYADRMVRRVRNPTNVIIDEQPEPQNRADIPQDMRRTRYLAAAMAQALQGLDGV